MDLSVDEIARLVGGTVVGDGALRIHGLNGLRRAEAGDLTFYTDPKYARQFEQTRASAVLVSNDLATGHSTLIRVANPHAAFAQMLHRLESETLRHPEGIHPGATIDASAKIGESVAIGSSVTVESGAQIGDRTVIYAGVYVGRDAVIGEDSILYPNVVVRERCVLGARCILQPNATIGGDGFGFAATEGRRIKIPQIGNVVLGDDVEIGANSSVDRATAGSTRIGTGTKLDSQVQIGHNVEVGEHCVICGCTGISGSTIVGNNVTIGGFCAIGGHLEIEDDVFVGGRSGVHSRIPAGSVVSDYPATDHRKVRRYVAVKFRLPEALKRLRQLEKRVDKLDEK